MDAIENANGEYQFLYALEDGAAWHGYGVGIPQNEFTLESVCEKRPLILSPQHFTPDVAWIPNSDVAPTDPAYLTPHAGQGSFRETGLRNVMRSLDQKWLGKVGGVFTIIDPQEALETVLDACGRENVVLSTMGNLDNGARAFFLIRDDAASFNVTRHDGSRDEVNCYTLVSLAYDGTGALRVTRTNVRVVCKNTESMAFQQGTSLGKVRHTSNYAERLDGIVEGIRAARDTARISADFANFLETKRIEKTEFSGILDGVIGISDGLTGKGRTRRENKRDKILDLFENGAGNHGATCWDAYNAVTDFESHHATLHGVSDDESTAAFQRQLNAFTSASSPLRQQVGDALVAA